MSEYNEPGLVQDARASRGTAIASMILGIFAVCFSWTPFIGLILAIVALNLAKKAGLAGNTSGFAKAGRTTGKVGLIISIIGTAMTVCYIIYVVCLGVIMQLLNM